MNLFYIQAKTQPFDFGSENRKINQITEFNFNSFVWTQQKNQSYPDLLSCLLPATKDIERYLKTVKMTESENFVMTHYQDPSPLPCLYSVQKFILTASLQSHHKIRRIFLFTSK